MSIKPLVAVLAVVIVASACNSADKVDDPVGVAGGLSGVSQTPPRVEGEWRVNTTVALNTCGSTLIPPLDTFVVRIHQAGSTLNGIVFDRCGNELSNATGTTDFTQIVTLAFTQSLEVGSGCTLKSEQAWTGTVQPDLVSIAGGRTVAVEGSGSCGSGLSCDITGGFTAERCPRGICTFDTCTP